MQHTATTLILSYFALFQNVKCKENVIHEKIKTTRLDTVKNLAKYHNQLSSTQLQKILDFRFRNSKFIFDRLPKRVKHHERHYEFTRNYKRLVRAVADHLTGMLEEDDFRFVPEVLDPRFGQ